MVDSISHQSRPTIIEILPTSVLKEEGAGAEGEGLKVVWANEESRAGLSGENCDGIFDLSAIIYDWRETTRIEVARVTA